MKYTVVKTVTQINAGANAVVHCDVQLFNGVDDAMDKASMMYGEIVGALASRGDLVATSYEQWGDKLVVAAKVFGHQSVIIIAVNAIDEEKKEVSNAND